MCEFLFWDNLINLWEQSWNLNHESISLGYKMGRTGSINFSLDHQLGTKSTKIFKEMYSKSQSLLLWTTIYINSSGKNVSIHRDLFISLFCTHAYGWRRKNPSLENQMFFSNLEWVVLEIEIFLISTYST